MNTVAETEVESSTEVFIETLKKVDAEIESAIETLEIISDKEALEGIREGLEDIKNGRVIGFEDFLRKYGKENVSGGKDARNTGITE